MGSSSEPFGHKFLVMLLGLLIGFVIGFVVLLSRLPVDDSLANLQAREAFRIAPKANAQDEKEDYKFYEVLPNQIEQPPLRVESTEPVVVARPEIKVVERRAPVTLPATVAPSNNRAIIPATRTVPANAQNLGGDGYTEVPASYKKNQSYFLQAGSFNDIQSAHAMRAQVLMLGLQAFVVEREEPGGGIRHRVRVGPYQALDLLTEAKKRLKRGGIRYEIVRVTG